jgi:DNA-binding CsgD family transcriptional regulator
LRDALRRAVLARESARSRRRTADGQRLWPSLVAGRWTLLDAFTAAGTRYVVACENPACSAGLRALPPRERIVLEHALGGRSGKWIAIELAVSEPTVARALRAALRRFGVRGIAALAGVRAALFEPLDGVHAVQAVTMARLTTVTSSLARLSRAERTVIAGLAADKPTAAIARERGSSVRTVMNQIASAYRKLGVSSRRELLAQLA